MVCAGMLAKVLLAATLFTQSGGAAAPQKSTITVHVYKGGLFSAFAHNHLIKASISKQTLDPKSMTAEIFVSAKEMKVIDPEASESTRAEIQRDMLGPKVLDTDKYPQIHFKSNRIEQSSPGHFRVTGTLELHGAGKEISFDVSGGPDHYHGSTKFKQTEFGIQPISIGGGTVKVKDQIDIEFDIYP